MRRGIVLLSSAGVLAAVVALLLLILTSNETVQDTPDVAIHEVSPIAHDETESTQLPLLTDPRLAEAIENSQRPVEKVLDYRERTKSELSDEERKQQHIRRIEILSVSASI